MRSPRSPAWSRRRARTRTARCARLAARIVTVSGFLKVLTEVIECGATEDGKAVLAAMSALPRLLDARRRSLKASDVDDGHVRGSWRSLVFPAEGKVDARRKSLC
jgi:hypothetical protein